MTLTAQANMTPDTVNTAAESSTPVDTSFQNHLVTGDIKNQGEWHRCLSIARELRGNQLWGGVLPLHICGDVSAIHHQIAFHEQLPHMKLVGNQWYCYLNAADIPVKPDSVAAVPLPCVAGKGFGDGDIDPAHYLDQKFEWVSDGGTHFNLLVQSYHAGRKAFLLYPIGGTIASFYRDEAFVYEHCQSVAQPVIREPLPEITPLDPYRFWNLTSMSEKKKLAEAETNNTPSAEIPAASAATASDMPSGMVCGCCGQPLVYRGVQHWPAKYNRKDTTLVECQNDDCIARYRTSSTESHAQICADAQKEQAS